MTGSPHLLAGVELRCTLLDAVTGQRRDVQVTAPVGATLADLLTASGIAMAPGWAATAGGSPVSGDHPIGRPPLLHGCLIVVGGPPAPVTDVRGVGLRLDVVGGPDAGRTLPLGAGDYVLGRCEPADLRLDDTQVSRRHAELAVRSGTVTARDLGSTNGTWLTSDDVADEAPSTAVGEVPLTLTTGTRLRLGRSTVALRVPSGRPASTRLTLTGRLEVNRPPRPQTPARSTTLERPVRPGPLPRPGVPWIGMAVPLALCLGAAWLLRQPTYLLFGLMSPLVLAGTSAAERLTRGRRRRGQEETWRRQVEAVEKRARIVLSQERAALRRTVGDPALVSRVASLPTSWLWERAADSADRLLVSVGTGDVRSADVSWAQTGAGDLEPPDAPAIPTMPDAPVTASLLQSGHLGLCGDRTTVLRLARWVVGQLVVWHGPGTVRLLVVTDAGTDEWDWTRWLPHTVSPPSRSASGVGTYLDEVVSRRRQQQLAGGPDETSLVVLVDGAQLAHVPGFAAALAGGPQVGVHVICLADERSALPYACGAVVDVAADGDAALQCAGLTTRLTVDGTRRPWAQTLARALAPLTDATPTPGRLPSSVMLLDLLPTEATSAEAIADSWRRAPRSTRAVVGRRVDGPFEIDLAADGPHLLVGGTTGSGKSELLRTLVTALAVANRPDEMTFVLVDYKGGAAFRGCADLVHTTGLVTDLDEQLAARALDSLDSELRRRERLLHDAGCRDVAEYQARRDSNSRLAPLPRLVLVIDEFRALAAELPEFLEGIVRVASLGRSLGVHVVLATQRPGGVVTADIRANVNLRISLRVRDRVDSDDVLESPDASAISPDTPGRAFVRRGGDALVAVQIARVDDRRRAAPTETHVVPLGPDDWPAPATQREATDTSDEVGDDLRRVVAACRSAAELLGVTAPAPVWTAPLPDRLPQEVVATADGNLLPGEAPIGLVDLPHRQLQQRLGWHPRRDGHLAVAGAPRTGRTSTLATIAAGLVRQWSPSDLHLHVVGVTQGPLASLAALPHTGTVVPADEPRRVARLVARLTAEVAERRRRGAEADVPALVLLVDGWEALVDQLEDVDHGRPVDDLLALLRDGESVGVRAIVTGGRGVLLSRVAAAVGQRLMLRPNDPTDLLLAGIVPSALPSRQPPGRAVRPSDGAQVQVALPPPVEEVSRGAQRWPAWPDVPPARRALRLRPLPTSVDAAALTVGPRDGRWALVGCGGDEAEAVGIDLSVDRCVLVAGPPGSGRSTTLVSMARSLHERGTDVLALCPGPSPLADGPWPVLRPDPAGAAQAELLGHAQVVLVDDVERLRDQPWELLLSQLAADPAAVAVVVAGTTAALLGTFRGLAGLGRSHRTGVLLRPESTSDGEVLGIRAELGDHDLVGRGLLVVRGRQTPVQVARWAELAAVDLPR